MALTIPGVVLASATGSLSANANVTFAYSALTTLPNTNINNRRNANAMLIAIQVTTTPTPSAVINMTLHGTDATATLGIDVLSDRAVLVFGQPDIRIFMAAGGVATYTIYQLYCQGVNS